MLIQRPYKTLITKPFPESSNMLKQKNEKSSKTGKITRRHTVQIRTVYVMAQKCIPANDFTDVMQLQKANDCKNADIFYTYPLVKSNQIENNLITDIKGCPFSELCLLKRVT